MPLLKYPVTRKASCAGWGSLPPVGKVRMIFEPRGMMNVSCLAPGLRIEASAAPMIAPVRGMWASISRFRSAANGSFGSIPSSAAP